VEGFATEEGWSEGWSDAESLNVDPGFRKTFLSYKTAGILLGFVVELADSGFETSPKVYKDAFSDAVSGLVLGAGLSSRAFGAVSELHPQLSV